VSEPIVEEFVEVRELPPGCRASRSLIVRRSDGTVGEAASFYADEWALTEGDLVGKTASEIRALCHARDVAYLQRNDGDELGEQPFFS
jgi:hypothetical protein